MNALRTLLPVLVVLAACAPPAEPPGDEPALTAQAAGPEQTARQLVADLLGIDAGQVRVIAVEAREFSDSSLDCPQPGMSYLQVITPGHRVLVEADGRRFDVRTSGGQGRICRRRKPDEADPDTDPRGSDQAMSALGRAQSRYILTAAGGRAMRGHAIAAG